MYLNWELSSEEKITTSDQTNSIVPTKLGITSDPPTLVLIYETWVSGKRKRRKRKIPLRNFNDHCNVIKTVFGLRKRHTEYLLSVPSVTLEKMMRIIQEVQKGLVLNQAIIKVQKEYEIDPNEDLNKLSTIELSRKKEIMDESFMKSLVKPGDPGYVYNKVVEFKKPLQAANPWDDDSDDEDLAKIAKSKSDIISEKSQIEPTVIKNPSDDDCTVEDFVNPGDSEKSSENAVHYAENNKEMLQDDDVEICTGQVKSRVSEKTSDSISYGDFEVAESSDEESEIRPDLVKPVDSKNQSDKISCSDEDGKSSASFTDIENLDKVSEPVLEKGGQLLSFNEFETDFVKSVASQKPVEPVVPSRNKFVLEDEVFEQGTDFGHVMKKLTEKKVLDEKNIEKSSDEDSKLETEFVKPKVSEKPAETALLNEKNESAVSKVDSETDANFKLPNVLEKTCESETAILSENVEKSDDIATDDDIEIESDLDELLPEESLKTSVPKNKNEKVSDENNKNLPELVEQRVSRKLEDIVSNETYGEIKLTSIRSSKPENKFESKFSSSFDVDEIDDEDFW